MPLNAKNWTVERYTRALVDGVWEEALDTTFTVVGALQPMSDRELREAPEGFRNAPGAKFKLYVRPDQPDLKVGGELSGESANTAPDRIQLNGRNLYVRGLQDFSMGILPYKKWLLQETETEVGFA